MALSGSLNTSVGSHWDLRLEWSGVQNHAENYTEITARLYWITDGYGAISSGATKTCSIYMNGWNDNTESGMAGLRANQKKQINYVKKKIYHNAKGEGDVQFGGYFDADVYLYGYGDAGRIRLPDRNWPLNTIPRESSLSTSPSFTAGGNRTVSISRASSSFSHQVSIYVKRRDGVFDWVSNLDFSTSQTSKSTSFTASEHEEIFKHLDGRASADVRMTLKTLSGSTTIGTTNYDGTVTAPGASSVSYSNFTIGDSVPISVSRNNGSFTHTLQIFFWNSDTQAWQLIKTQNSVGTGYTWTPSGTELNNIYNCNKYGNNIGLKVECTTRYGAEQVRSTTSKAGTSYLKNADPSFIGNYNYEDINAASLAITGNKLFIVQKASKVRVTLPATSKANPNKGANMVEYQAALGKKTVSKPYSSTANIIFDFDTIDANTNQTLSIKAIDSRGNYAVATMSVIIIPYDQPAVSLEAERQNKFESATILKLSGTVSKLTVNGVNKNALTSAKYRYKQTTATAWGSYANFATAGFPQFSSTDVTLTLANTKSWDIEVVVTDKLGTTTITRKVTVGKPLFFVDDVKNSIGFNDFPIGENEFRIAGRIVFGANQWASNSTGEGFGVIDLQNSDVTGANGIYFADIANNSGEGLMFLKSGKPAYSTNRDDYDQFRVLDGIGYLGSKPIFTGDDEILWSGSLFMDDRHSIVPTKRLSQCANGWLLVWSGYDGSTARNYDWNFTFVQRKFGTITTGGFWANLIGEKGNLTRKYLYASDTTFSGHSSNNVGSTLTNTVVLRYVMSF